MKQKRTPQKTIPLFFPQVLLLFAFFSLEAAQTARLPFLAPTDPELDPTCKDSAHILTWLNNSRSVNLTLPEDFSQIDPDNSMTNFDGSGSSLATREKNVMIYANPSDTFNSAWGDVFASFSLNAEIVDYAAATTQEAAEAYLGTGNIIYEENGVISYQIVGSTLHNLQLKCTTWIEETQDYLSLPDPDPGGRMMLQAPMSRFCI